MKYEEMSLEAPILRAIQEIGFTEPTPIQEQSIPLIREGRDLIGQSETGSGKTAAFGLPILEKINPSKGLQAFILSPTRELADQIAKNLMQFSKYKRCKIVTIYGGVSINPQIDAIRTADVIVGTPGRTLDHLRRGTLSLQRIKFLVLDEADKMFEMGFIDDITQIMRATPRNKQILMFSATISQDIQRVILRQMNNPASVKTSTHVSSKMLQQIYYNTRRNEKFSLLVHIIKTENPERAIVFCGRKTEIRVVVKNLVKQGVDASELHGGLSQNKRNFVMDQFKQGRITILVASDVAARGIDVAHLTHIINYSIPKNSQEYVHRIGRTARMGHAGVAINLLDETEHDNFRAVLSDRSLNIEKRDTPQFPRIEIQRVNFESSRGLNRFRGRGPPRDRYGGQQQRDRFRR